MPIVQISRDPFARESIVREAVDGRSCHNCGNSRYRNGKKIARLFRYGIEHDRIRNSVVMDNHDFCSWDCRQSYYN